MSIAKLKRLQDEFLSAIGTDRHDSAKLRLMATTNAILPLLVIAAAADRLDRAIAKLEGGKE